MHVHLNPKRRFRAEIFQYHCRNPDPREDPKSRSLNGGSYKVPLVV